MLGGHYALKLLTQQLYEWYGNSFLMTSVDAYDVMLFTGLKKRNN
jgi:hypothetical protein